MRTFYILLVWAILAALALAGMTPKTPGQASGANSAGKDRWNFNNIIEALNRFKTYASFESKKKCAEFPQPIQFPQLLQYPELKYFPSDVLSFVFGSDNSNAQDILVPDPGFWQVVFGIIDRKDSRNAWPSIYALGTLLHNFENAALRALLLTQGPSADFVIKLEKSVGATIAFKLFEVQLNAVAENGKGKGKESVGVNVEDEVERDIQPSKSFFSAWHLAQDTFIYRLLQSGCSSYVTRFIKILPYEEERVYTLLGLAVFALNHNIWLLKNVRIDCSKVKTKYQELCEELRTIAYTENQARLLCCGRELLTELEHLGDEFKPDKLARDMEIPTG
ncbi:hypothetical protein IWQ61_009690 [Dispira simplex]|nr:hypothetical protein IWQ61_009690 [Dispira simplex]